MVRLDRLLTIAIFGPMARLTGAEGRGIPILMYHSVSHEKEHRVHPYYRLCTTPRVFASHMALLGERGYQVVNLEAAVQMLRAGRSGHGPGATQAAVITFDDGFLDFYTDAYPILAARGYTATVFLPTAFVGKKNGFVEGKQFLCWDQVRELSALGVSFGSHSVSHQLLTGMESGKVVEELKRSKESIENETGRPVREFSYPYAFPEHRRDFTAALRATLVGLGYLSAVTTCVGTALPGNDVFFLRRLPANDADDEALFWNKLVGSYNWLHAAQYSSKFVRRCGDLMAGKDWSLGASDRPGR